MAADDLEHTIDFFEVKRNPERYRKTLLEEKIQTFLCVKKHISSWPRTLQCLSLDDM